MNLRISGMIAFSMTAILSFQLSAVSSHIEPSFQEPLKSYKVLSHETHKRVLDILFPRDEAHRDYDFVLRFEPSFAPESQIVVKRSAGKVEVTIFTSMSGNIYGKLNGVMAHGGKEDPVEMAKLIQVRKRTIEVPNSQLRQWRRSLIDSVGRSMKTMEQRSIEAEKGIGTITLDGTFYELWYDQVGSHISFSLMDHEVSDQEVTGEFKLVRWMNAVRRDVEKIK